MQPDAGSEKMMGIVALPFTTVWVVCASAIVDPKRKNAILIKASKNLFMWFDNWARQDQSLIQIRTNHLLAINTILALYDAIIKNGPDTIRA
jgi:hypothetical protein